MKVRTKTTADKKRQGDEKLDSRGMNNTAYDVKLK